MFFISIVKKHFLQNARNLLGCRFYQNNFITRIEKNTKTSCKKISRDTSIENINKAGIGLLTVIPFPSKKEETYKFFPFGKLFQSNLLKNKSRFILNFSIYENKNKICVYFSNQPYSKTINLKKQQHKGFFFGTLKEFQNNEKKDILDVSNKGESSVNGGFFSALNAACLDKVFVLILSEDFDCKKKIDLIFEKNEFRSKMNSNQKLIIIVKKNTVCKIGQYNKNTNNLRHFDNMNISIILEQNSKLEYHFVSKNSKLAVQVTSVHVQMQKNTHLEFFSIFSGGKSRNNLGIDIDGINSSINIKGISTASSDEIIDFHSRISHNYPESVSSQLHKNLVSGDAHVIFAGKIQIHSGAFNTESKQLSKTLLLSCGSKVDIMPVLEINNQNVKCTHGSTVASIDKNQLFYLQSRGISDQISSKLLERGFITDVIGKFSGIFELHESA